MWQGLTASEVLGAAAESAGQAAEAGRVSQVAPEPGYTNAPMPAAFCP